MARQPTPLFLARSAYRRRRLRDAARLLPIVGLFLLHVPSLWQAQLPQLAAQATARGILYVFVVWALMIACAAALAPSLTLPDSDPRGTPDKEA